MIDKKVEKIERKSENLVRHDKVNRLKELGFTTNWNINEQKKDYDALEDPHADKYFQYQSVKHHIKELRKSIAKSERNDGEKKKITRLIKEKLTDHLPAIKIAQTYNVLNPVLNKSQTAQKLSTENPLEEIEKSLKKNKKRRNKLHNHKQTDGSENLELNFEESGTLQEKTFKENETSQETYKLTNEEVKNQQPRKMSKKKKESLHRIKHEDFIAFIAKKKENIASANKTNE